MKTLGTQLALFLDEPQLRRNLGVLWKFILLVVVVIVFCTVTFQIIMTRVEGQEHSWFAGFYWTMVTMSTLGFGDIVFETDLGRAFSVLVLGSGVLLLLVVLPFVFIRYFYAPWLEAQVRLRAPRELPASVHDHVILCDYDVLAPGVIEQLQLHRIPYVVLEADAERATRLRGEGIQVVYGDIDATRTFERVGVHRARLVVTNLTDVQNTNIILTVRELSADVPIAAIASSEDAVDLMELAGADHVLPLRTRLGEQLANRINAGHAQTHAIGHFRDLVLAEFPVLNTPLAGKTVRETKLRELLGLSIVGIWEKGALGPARPDDVLTEHALPIVLGTAGQMKELDELLYIYDTNWNPVIVIGGGKVGRAATRTLQRQGVTVHMIERKEKLAQLWEKVPDRMFVGDAANRELLEEAGVHEAPAVLLTTNDDAMNVFLAVYCRRLNPDLRIVSRVTHDRNVSSIQRAGADLVLSYAALGMEAILSLARERTLVLLGEGVELFEEVVPLGLEGKTLAESKIGAEVGMNVVAIERDGELTPAPMADEILEEGTHLYLIGSPDQLQEFKKKYRGP